MNLRIGDVTLLSAGETVELFRRLPDSTTSAPIAAMIAGEPVSATVAWVALECDLRLAAGLGERAHALIDLASDRLEAAYPQLARST